MRVPKLGTYGVNRADTIPYYLQPLKLRQIA